MIPVYQTVHGAPGNCFEACLASIVECKIDDVPKLYGWRSVQEWLQGIGWRFAFNEIEGYSVASVKTPTGIHAVVCVDGQIVHDPSPRPYADASHPVLIRGQLRKL